MCNRWFGDGASGPPATPGRFSPPGTGWPATPGRFSPPGTGWPPAYLAPNERHPQRMQPLTQAAMTGVYVGVGTERCWMAAALIPQLRRLYLVDCDPRVVYYNRVNAALLHAAAGVRTDYVHLRLQAAPPEWVEAAAALPEPRGALLRNPAAHAWWTRHVRQSPRADMRLFHTPPQQPPHAFAGANYLWNDALFARVSRFATRENGIDIKQLDLGRQAHMSNLRRALAWRGERISVLDISNAWWPAYLSTGAVRQLLETLEPVLTADSLLLATSRHRHAADGESEFHYFAAHPLRALRTWMPFCQYLRQLHDTPREPGHVDCVDGHLVPSAPLAQAAA